MSATAQEVLDVMRSWIGYSESNGKHKKIIDVYNSHKPLARGYKLKYTDDWCDGTVSAAAIKAGAVDIIGTEVGVERHVDIFKKKGIWIEDGSVKPQVGDVIVYSWSDSVQPNNAYSDHIGFVEQVYGNTIIALEGNYCDKVGRRTIHVGWGYIRGFARPKYKAESVTTTTTATKKPATTSKKAIDTVANEVIRGAWGSGALRKSALTKAGYDYETVQARVNEIYKKSRKKSVKAVAEEVIQGLWGNGNTRYNALKRAGYDPVTVQNKVNELLRK